MHVLPTRLLPLLRATISSCSCLGRRRAHAAPAGVRRRAGGEEEEAAEHAADDPLQHRPSLGDVARVHSLRRRVVLAAGAALSTPTSGTHGGGAWLGERRAVGELRRGARANWGSVAAAAAAMSAHL